MTARIGEPAPTFDLRGVDGADGGIRRFTSAEFIGSPLIIAFYPSDNSPVCTRQLVSYTEGIDVLANSGIRLVAISPQDPQSHLDFAAAHGGFRFPLLSDGDRSVGREFGILGLLDLYRRSTVLIDADGIVRYTHRSLGPGVTFRPLPELVKLVEEFAIGA